MSAWFPDIAWHWLDVADPRWTDACNLMACGIRLVDRVHTVSPTYAREICRPDDLPRFHGAQGLEAWFPNFIFLHGFSDQTAWTLYANGDLFFDAQFF